jgi:hypothetical protein
MILLFKSILLIYYMTISMLFIYLLCHQNLHIFYTPVFAAPTSTGKTFWYSLSFDGMTNFQVTTGPLPVNPDPSSFPADSQLPLNRI